MKALEYRYFIRSGWHGRPESPASVGAKFVDTLDALTRINPIFANWLLTDLRTMSSLPLAAARSNIAALVEKNVVLDDFRKPSPDRGYHAIGRTGKFKDPRSTRFKVDAGGKYRGGTLLEFGEHDVAPDLTIVTYPLFKAILLAINAIWLPPWACANAFRSNTVKVTESYPGGVQGYRLERLPMIPSEPTFPKSVFHIPWITYLSASLAAGLDLPDEILTERTPDGGLLMIAVEQRLDPENPAHLRRARILAETMIARSGYSPS